MICECCGREFLQEDADYEFSQEFPTRNYDYLNQSLCGSCAINLYNDQVDGIYNETCEKCGKEFDYFEEDSLYRSLTKLDIGLEDLSRILCCDCGLEQENIDFPSEDGEEDFDSEDLFDDED